LRVAVEGLRGLRGVVGSCEFLVSPILSIAEREWRELRAGADWWREGTYTQQMRRSGKAMYL
jgi:hypothetical protein